MSRYERRRKEDLEGAAGLLGKALGRKEIFERLEARQVSKSWANAVGEHLASRSSPEKFEFGILTVAVTSAPWLQELRLRQKELLDRLNAAAGRELFTELKFVVRAKQKATTVEEVAQTFEPEEIDLKMSMPEIEDVVKRALGRLRAASKRKK